MQTLGINIGSSSIKVVLLKDMKIIRSQVTAHEGNFTTAEKIIGSLAAEAGNCLTLITGTEGRFLFNLNNVIEPLCIEEAVKHTEKKVNAVVSMGGEDLVVYTIDEHERIIANFSGSKCASGTGEFFKQQLTRMDMSLERVNSIPDTCRVLPLSSRCSVFMKSDCTHRLNKGEATREDIALSLSEVMATKVIDFLKRAKIKQGRVLLAGGVTQNRHIIRFIREKKPEIEFLVPPEAAYFEAYGAALLAQKSGSPLPAIETLMKLNMVRFERFKSLKKAGDMVSYLPSKAGRVQADREYILGVDGGSTTTKACLIDLKTDRITASYYGRTYGDPVRALKKCLIEIKKQVQADIGKRPISIPLAAVTGSSREILGVFLKTPAVYNEIIAHTRGTTFYNENIDTIFEIGGQDAKYVFLKNKVPIDYAMNEACSAGTGSFLEESAQGDLNILKAEEIGGIALQAEQPLKFGEHCSAFINSDIRKAIQQGAYREDITAGIVTSIVSNYLNRVVGNRTIGSTIVLQGGVAKNRAVTQAFALLLNKKILVPPHPELMGCFGVGILARQKLGEGILTRSFYDLDTLIETEIVYEKEFKCRSCENYCPIRVLNVSGRRTMFGGRCNKYANLRKKKRLDENRITDYVEKRRELMFKECAPDPGTFLKRREPVIGIPKCFSVYTLYPFYSWFFHTLGIRTFLSGEICHAGVSRTESTYCFPVEIAHGAVQDIINQGADYIFVPHMRDMPSYERTVHATFCPLIQSLPYYIQKAFPEIEKERLLNPVVSFKFGKEKALESFLNMGVRLGIPKNEIRTAFDLAFEKQQDYLARAKELGRRALAEAREANRPVIAILGRPYNAFTRDANMGIPKKFTSRGYSVIPFDILPFEDQVIFPNMYWYIGQMDMKSASFLKHENNIYVTYITNFSCAPDSFMLHYMKWIMGTKPFLILELDSHTADAGVDTRVEAFLDIIEGYKLKFRELGEEKYDNGLRFVNNGKEEIHLRNINTGEKIQVRHNPRVKLLLSNMGSLATELMAAVVRSVGFEAEALPVADIPTLQIARNHTSGKECLPSHLILGSVLKYLSSEKNKKDQIYIVFVPKTTGPCRTGQYFVFYENLFKDLRLENVIVLTLSADNSYNELGPDFSKHMWWALVVADYMKDLETTLLACAADPGIAHRRYGELWRRLIGVAEKDITGVVPTLKEIARDISGLPLKRKLSKCPKVFIVGEIYVRRDDFAVHELLSLFSDNGIIAKVSGVTEWIYYLDFIREYDLKKRLRLVSWYEKPFSPLLRKLLYLKIEKAYKLLVERKVKKALKTCRLIPNAPHGMKKIMANTEKHFLSHELNSEIAVSSGVAAAAMKDGYSGVVNISPFACLIGRVIEGLFTPWARERRYPTISVEVDGNLLPPNMVNKLDIFMLSVRRHRQNQEAVDLTAARDSSGEA